MAMASKPFRLGTVRCGGGGFSLIELILAVAIMAIAVFTLMSTLGTSMVVKEMNRETALAMEAAQKMIEKMQDSSTYTYSQIFAAYNMDPQDDPGGPGTAPGQWFAVAGLNAAPGNQNVGRIIFSTQGVQLREDVVDASLGMPRDLNGDNVIDTANHSSDYILLPVTIRIQWMGIKGARTLELKTLLTNR